MNNESNIILASASPRRKALLSSLGYDFTIIPSDVEEIIPKKMAPEAVAEYLARLKADDIFQRCSKAKTVIGADTIVVLGKKILGKPNDRQDAYRMLSRLSDKMHFVYTGIAIFNAQRKISFTACTKVYFRALSDSEITKYVDSGLADDKAGAYGIQDWIGMAKISKIEGSYNNVIGLPTSLVYEAMRSIDNC